ncbi:MAG TPA: FmdB family zinc ribbon protein [Actinomycetota bacterium]|nr:FmdB family zinc ribbon protein [Actinomycetota bacterium]
MPTYEYACRSCGHTFEIVQSMSDDALTTCPKCAGELRKVFAPPAIAFKGSGFYATDHGKKSKPGETPEKEKTSGDGKEPATSGTSTDAKRSSDGGSTPTSSAASTPAKPAKETTSS